jgi:hypothetical protein
MNTAMSSQKQLCPSCINSNCVLWNLTQWYYCTIKLGCNHHLRVTTVCKYNNVYVHSILVWTTADKKFMKHAIKNSFTEISSNPKPYYYNTFTSIKESPHTWTLEKQFHFYMILRIPFIRPMQYLITAINTIPIYLLHGNSIHGYLTENACNGTRIFSYSEIHNHTI